MIGCNIFISKEPLKLERLFAYIGLNFEKLFVSQSFDRIKASSLSCRIDAEE